MNPFNLWLWFSKSKSKPSILFDDLVTNQIVENRKKKELSGNLVKESNVCLCFPVSDCGKRVSVREGKGVRV